MACLGPGGEGNDNGSGGEIVAKSGRSALPDQEVDVSLHGEE